MTRPRPSPQTFWRLSMAAFLLLGVLCAGCGTTGNATEDSAGTGGTAGSGGSPDGAAGGAGAGPDAPAQDGGTAGFEENPYELLLADPERNPSDYFGADALDPRSYAEAAAACYAPSDPSDVCSAPACSAFASCCVDTALCCQPVTEEVALPALLDFQACAGLTLEACVEAVSLTTFGTREPLLTGRGLIPNGTATAEGGALIGDIVNLSTDRVMLDVQFTLPLGCNGTCLESAGVAFTASEPDVFVDVGVGLLLSGSRDTVSLIVGDEVTDSFDAGSDGTTWSLLLSPSGSVEVHRDGALEGVYTFDPASLTDASLAVFGRNLSAADTSAALARIEIGTARCDNPEAWANRQPVTVLVQGAPVSALRAPSIASDEATTWLAFETGDGIFVGERQAGELVVIADPVLVPSEPYEALGIGDPELVWDGAAWSLFYTARDENGAGSIRSALGAPSLASFVRSETPVLAPSADVTSFDAPSVVYRDGLWIMVVRATLASETTELRAYYTSDLQAGWARVVNGGLEPLSRVDVPTSEIGSPSLIVHNSAYHLYYARRTGTRWAVELAVSDELVRWRPIGPVLGASGVGFDSLGASGPDALSQTGRIDLVYTGQDGISFQLGSASRPAPSDTAPSIF